jgi:hypothetical protein
MRTGHTARNHFDFLPWELLLKWLSGIVLRTFALGMSRHKFSLGAAVRQSAPTPRDFI